ncbi:MAG: hypothetical protein ACRDTD_25395, partial [Pseudonocardiaceae bacterium]
WLITGVRHDPYAREHPLEVEVDKPEAERGYYLHPEVHGLPRDQAMPMPAQHPSSGLSSITPLPGSRSMPPSGEG